MINDRYINLPPKLIPLQNQTLLNDLNDLKSKGPTSITQTEYLLVITKAAKQPRVKGDSIGDLLLYHFEDSEFLKHAEDYWMFPDESKVFGKQSSLHLHYVISLEKYLTAIPRLKALVIE